MKFGRNVVKEETTQKKQKNYQDEDKKSAINKNNSQIKKPHLKMIQLKTKQVFFQTVSMAPQLWMHDVDTNKMHREKTRWELNKKVACGVVQILEAIPHKTAAIQSLTSHSHKPSSKLKKTCRALLEKQGWTSKWYYLMDSCTWTYCWPTSKDLDVSPLCKLWMQATRPTWSDGWWG